MIGRLRGSLAEVGPDHIIVDVGGVGYRVHVPQNIVWPPMGEVVTLYVHTHVRDDAIILFGFEGRSELSLFETLIGVTGVGPKLALSVLSHLSPDAFATAVLAGEATRLTKIPGIGKKTAARILLEVKDRIRATWDEVASTSTQASPAGLPGDTPAQTAMAALVALGFSEGEASLAVSRAIEAHGAFDSSEELMKAALKNLDRGSA